MTISRFTARDMTSSIRRVGDARVNFLVNGVFKRGANHATDIIDFGVMKISKRAAVYQRPGGMAVPVNKSTGGAKTVRAPKIREKIVLDENFATVLNPALDSYAGPYTDPQAQLAEKTAIELAKLRRRADMAVEIQAAQALQTGETTITYEDGGTETIDFGYTGDGATAGDSYTIQKTLSGTAAWDKSGSNPLNDLEALAGQIRDHSVEAGPLDVIMGLSAWTAFFNNEKVQKLFDIRRIDAGSMSIVVAEAYRGPFAGLRIFTYSNGYFVNNTRTAIWDPKKIVVLPRQDSGLLTIEHGAVYEQPNPGDSARWIQTDWFSKWVHHQDPPVDEIIVETRPLALIKDPDAIRVLQVVA